MFEATAHRDGYVSIEVDPRLAYDTLTTFREAMRLHEAIDKPNLMVKIPATKPGLGAIEDAIAKGRSINITLIFSLERYAEVAESYVRGLERLVAEGGDPTKVASVASFFVSRIDTEADRRLEEAGAPKELQGKLAIANAKLAYQHYKEVFSGARWEFLVGKGATPQRVLWASTSTKNPDYPDVLYVEELLGPETVNTMPEETVKDYQDHGSRELRLERDIDGARRVFEQLEQAGVSYKDITDTLEREGVEKFSDAFAELTSALGEKRESLVAGLSAGAERRPTPRIGSSGVGHGIEHADRQRPARERFGVDREDAEAPASVGVGAGRGHFPGARAEAVLDQARPAVGPAHVHQDAQPDEPARQPQVALVVLDREHEAADRLAVQAQVGVTRARARTGRRGRRAAGRPRSRAAARDGGGAALRRPS